MKTPVIDVEATEPQIIACAACGKSNRVYKRNQRGRFKCGACKANLPDPFSLTRRVSSIALSMLPGRAFRRRATMLLLVGASIAVVVALIVWLTPKPAVAPLPVIVSVTPLSPPRHLPNATIISGLPLEGHGTLEIDNGTPRDAVVKVVDVLTHHAIEACYISAGGKVSIQNIPDGAFAVFFSSGSDFDPTIRGFTREKGFSRFVDDLAFTTEVRATASGTNTQYTIFTLTLHPVANGNAKTNSVSEAEFLKL